MKIIKRILFSVIGLAVAGALVFGIILAVNTDLSNPDSLDEFLMRKFDKLGVTGMAVSLVEGDDISSFYGFGRMDMETDRPVTADTIFAMASTSKTVTGTAVMQLVESSSIELDGDISIYLPFKVRNPNYPDDIITTRMLLTHTSSIIDNWDVYDPLYTIDSGGGDSPISLAEFCRNYFAEDGDYYDEQQNFSGKSPGSERVYSNCGFGLLGYLVEVVSKQPFSDYCREHIFVPLGMDNTAWLLSELDENKIAKPYNGKGEALPHYSFPTYPDGGLRTSPADFSRFISMMMNGGSYHGVRILRESTVEEMTSPQIREIYQDQGLAWELRALEEFKVRCDEDVIGHSGGDFGMATYAFYVPRNQKGAVLMINDNLSFIKLLNYLKILKRLLTEIS